MLNKSLSWGHDSLFLCNELLLISQSDFAGVGPGKQIAIGTGEFEDIKCGYHLTQEKKPYKTTNISSCKNCHQLAWNPFYCDHYNQRFISYNNTYLA